MMMQKQKSPPKHRHDGTSPLPLGMDWSPAPKKWDGRATVWPHDAHTGWSYCVTIPSWIILPKSRDAEGIVFYSVQVGIQSPEGDSTSRGVLRRFSDFMRLSTELKRAFPKKNLPPAPPKHVLRINSSRSLPEERRFALEEWMGRLLSDIDLSRSVPVASFLELEAAARSLFHDINQQTLEGDLSGQSVGSLRQSSGVSILASTSSITPDYVSDAYETSELGTPRQGRDNSSETGTEDLELDQDLSGPRELTYNTSNDDGGLFMGGNILDERFPTRKVHSRKERGVTGRDVDNGNSSKTSYFLGGNMDSPSKSDNGKSENGRFSHARKLSSESAGSDISSIKGSNLSITGLANSLGDSSTEFAGGAEVSTSIGILGREGLQFPDDIQVVLPLDQRHKMNRVLLTMQRRLATAKTDMEDLIARLNQEIAVKEYLTTKVKDLEVELETSKQKSKENLQQAILVERERFTQMQWDMEELRRKSLEMEWRLKSEEEEKDRTESTKTCALQEKDMLLQELDSTKQKLVSLQKVHEELLLKSKADTKVLVKEVKSLRNSQSELKQELGQSLKERSELEAAIQNEKQRTKHAKNARAKLLHECEVLRTRLQECSVNLFEEDEDKFTVDSSSLSDALDLLTTSDNRIGFLLAEAQLLAEYDEDTGVSPSRSQRITGENLESVDYQTRKMLTDLFVDNAKLRKQVNSVIRCAIKTTVKSEKEKEEQEEKEEVPSRKTVLNKFLDR